MSTSATGQEAGGSSFVFRSSVEGTESVMAWRGGSEAFNEAVVVSKGETSPDCISTDDSIVCPGQEKSLSLLLSSSKWFLFVQLYPRDCHIARKPILVSTTNAI